MNELERDFVDSVQSMAADMANGIRSQLGISPIANYKTLNILNPLSYKQGVALVRCQLLRATNQPLSHDEKIEMWHLVNDTLFNQEYPMLCTGFWSIGYRIRLEFAYHGYNGMTFQAISNYLDKGLYNYLSRKWQRGRG